MALSEYDLEDPLESPLLVFELKYMSRALLELNGYVKRHYFTTSFCN